MNDDHKIVPLTKLYVWFHEPSQDLLDFDACHVCGFKATDPRVLACGHSCCRWCLPPQVSVCPVVGCDAIFDALPRDTLPKNWIVSKFSKDLKEAPPMCHVCNVLGVQTVAAVWCGSCSKTPIHYFCSACFGSEHSSVKDRDHVPILLNQMASTLPTCPKHNLLEDFYCFDENIFVCSECLVYHKDHNTKLASLYHQKMKSDLKLSLKTDKGDLLVQSLMVEKGKKLKQLTQAQQDILKLESTIQEAHQKYESVKTAELVLTKKIQNLPIRTLFDDTMLEILKTRIEQTQQKFSARKPWNYVSQLSFGVECKGKTGNPISIAIDKLGMLFVGVRKANKIEVFQEDGTFVRSMTRPELLPSALVFDATGNLVVLSSGNPSSAQICGHRKLRCKTEFGSGRLQIPCGIAVTSSGDFVIADAGTHMVQIFDPTGNWLRSFGTFGKKAGQLCKPVGVAVHGSTGNILVSEFQNNRIQIFTSTGNHLRYLGSPGTEIAQLDRPWGITVAVDGTVIVVDQGNNRCQFFSQTGEYITNLASGLKTPVAVILDSENKLLVTDSALHKVQIYALT